MSSLSLFQPFVQRLVGRPVALFLLACLTLPAAAPVATLLTVSASTPAAAQCAQNGGTINCSGNLSGPQNFNTSSGANDLEIFNVTAGPSQASLQGTGTAAGNGTAGVGAYTCSSVGNCTIDNTVQPPTCTVNSGAPTGTTCVPHQTQAGGGPSGNAGPAVTINVNAPPTGPVTIGGSSAINPPVAVFGKSVGSQGGTGGHAVFDTGGTGGSGVDGGSVNVTFTGQINANQGGLLAQSVGGNGGTGGDSTFGSGGQGGLAGFGGTANVQFNGGSISTTGDGNNGITAISNGGNGGTGGNGGITFIYSIGGAGNQAGQAGLAEVVTASGTTISTSGNYASGIAAMSIGGAGGSGNGGFGLFYSGGGGGGTGGNGGTATVNSASTITTFGQFAYGILGQSIGGGGGNAGNVAGAFSFGANGNAGGQGGQVSIGNSGTIATAGFGSNAIEAQSIGGTGGNGSNSGGLLALGGNGAGTSTGGAVSVNNTGTLQTLSQQAAGIFAQSIGGGGGNGGTSAGLFAAGGTGGSGADGGTVAITNSGNISTGQNGGANGASSPGILAQSVGGGGGNGGGAISVGPGISAAFGGTGGPGGQGNTVSILTNTGDLNTATAYSIQTAGDDSAGIVAQSIGGGGGNGGFAASFSANPVFSIAIGGGGQGGSGNSAGAVNVSAKGSITTQGVNSDGILAQSLGGGGGNGGFAVTGSISAGASIGVTLGGTGGTGGVAQKVTVTTQENIQTGGDNSVGILAQSIGGGGGNGGFSAGASGGGVGVQVGIGGGAGTGATAGDVTLSNVGNISTQGVNSAGLLGQSIGGGGGNGGFAAGAAAGAVGVNVGLGGQGGVGGAAGNVNVSSTGNVSTLKDNSVGVAAESLGGGGGNGGFTVGGSLGAVGVNVTIGGTGGSGGVSGTATASSSGAVATQGANSDGVLALALGGGGGNGGFSASATLGAGLGVSVGLGGNGGLGENAGAATVNADGGGHTLTVTGFGSTWNTVTLGANSYGVAAQSIGGGGGNGGFSGSLTLGGSAVGVNLGGSGGGGGNSGVATTNSGNTTFVNNVFTNSDDSSGVVAQSIGGGGGNGGFAGSFSFGGGTASVGVALGGQGGAGGSSIGAGPDNVAAAVNSIGNITTRGNLSNGILAQSVGGGGGNGGFSLALSGGSAVSASVALGGNGGAGGSASSVTVNSQGDIQTFGQQSDGIFAQSVGGGGGNGGFAGAGSIGGIGISVGAGGTGGVGGAGGEVTVNSTGNIQTSGNGSSAIFAQSIGGGGGNGGSTLGLAAGAGAVSVNVGGSAGGGNNSGNVNVTSTGNLFTGVGSTSPSAGANASGIVAQSIGGGGGNGGFSGNLSAGVFGAVGVSVGGKGGTGGSAGTVTVTSAGNIGTVFDNSSGVLAQSIGGGGGNGGFSLAFSASGSYGAAGGSAAVSVGGFGGNAGSASDVSVTNSGLIGTQGANSDGIAAQSIGGGGGNGGFSIAGTFTTGAVGLGVSVGGFGAGGGAAGNVTVESYNASNNGQPVLDSAAFGTTTLSTQGPNSNGILAQSLGGGGGNGGFSVAGGVALQGVGAGVSVGGFGAGGGNGKAVSVTSYNNIVTKGSMSNGILAQSFGGGGGNGGFSVAGGGGSDAGVGVSVGGFALGGGGSADKVTVDSFGTIATQGSDSNGISAQSIGGGGGNGGFSVAGALSTGPGAIPVSVGGAGSTGGSAGAVVVNSYAQAANGAPVTDVPDVNTTTIFTQGDRSNGIEAQSLGGGGGNGGFSVAGGATTGAASVNVSVGGFGAGGGSASSVNVTSYQNIVTLGQQSNGILAQSLGGGGGNGGFSVAGGMSTNAAVSISVGGSALGGGGSAGAVKVVSNGTILTQGNDSNAIAAQSIGGGGGNGGFSVAGGLSTGNAGVTASVGGFGSTGSTGGSVEVDSYSLSSNGQPLLQAPAAGTTTIETEGARSNGILAQSIGGGGGNGGFSVSGAFSASGGAFAASVGGFGAGGGSASNVTVNSYNNIVTLGADSNGIEAQSLGGGGGNGGFSVAAGGGSKFGGALSIGGFALTGGGNAGTVDVTSLGTISTQGDRSNGIEAQSIGGSGGNGGFSLAGSLSLNNAGVSASIGGGGSGGGAGGAVTVNSNVGTTLANNNATIETQGQSANGIFAQSVGGGGGSGGFSGAVAITAEAKASMALSVGGFGAAGNTASSVAVNSVDNILTTGAGSDGILAQSIGGGGGNGGFSFAGTISAPQGNSFTLSASLGGFGGSAGNAGTVTVDSTGLISTEGNNAAGVAAQSLGGGGGNGGLSVAGAFNFTQQSNSVPQITASVGGFGGAGGAGNDVQVTRVGNTTTKGDSSVGIMAQSVGGGGGNGGLSVSGSIGGPDAKQITASVGGFGGAGSNAGNVAVNNTGDIFTGTLTQEQQVIAQVGQTFQVVPGANGLPSVVPLAQDGVTFQTVNVITGRDSDGILAQSIGGGGGNGGFAFSGSLGPVGEGTALQLGVTVGGFGGSGGTAGNVNVTNVGMIQTLGDGANGIEAQSIGGGGGNGGGAVTGIAAGGDPQGGGRAINVAVAVGGAGGSGNTAGNVTVNQSGGPIITAGATANGIQAQSIGGGGGNGGNANSVSFQVGTSCTFNPLGLVGKVISACQSAKKSSWNVQVDVGGKGGTGADAGMVTVDNSSNIFTGAKVDGQGNVVASGAGQTSAGILAQSIGGGGGNGGQAIVGLNGLFPGAEYVDIATTILTVPTGLSGVTTAFGKITVGGAGGASGNGAAVNVTNSGVIQTNGDTAPGIQAQSIGGGGGNGGNAASGITGLFSLGGSGGASGSGGDVTVQNLATATSTGNISTFGGSSDAILAQSIGGGGGNGGESGGIISIGGSGGVNSNGGKVSVTNAATLTTVGDKSSGIVAQSVGGGGGTGFQTSVDDGTGTGGKTNLSILAFGGTGAGGGNGGKVSVNNQGLIFTSGADAYGVLAQSIGGGGGNGGATGVAVASVVPFTRCNLTILSATVTLGGCGGAAGQGGDVDVTNTAQILTTGAGSNAIFAQSIGGGGGNAGTPSVAIVSMGGSGGSGGNGGKVVVDNSAALFTNADNANGVLAQSVGGGGGTGGRAVGIVEIGGSGGDSGNGGEVDVTNSATASISTLGVMSNGIFAQSLGAGGGIAGGAYSGTPINFQIKLGDNGASGNGGNVNITNDGQITTVGQLSDGILAQSIGGGGGFTGVIATLSTPTPPTTSTLTISVGGAGVGGGKGGDVSVTNSGSIYTQGALSNGIAAQSLGGGGGIAGTTYEGSPVNFAMTVGLNGGDGGDAGLVNVTNSGQIRTDGISSQAILAQSVGGGGGAGGLVATFNDVLTNSTILVGGTGGNGGNGGAVTVKNQAGGNIAINGASSTAIFAQSIGGGGGIGGSVVSIGNGVGGAPTVAVTLGGNGGNGGKGGDVNVTNDGTIFVNGKNSVGVMAQSVGGGGGVAGSALGAASVPVFLGGQNGVQGKGGDVTVTNNGSIYVNGANSIGLFAQSVGGGGGMVQPGGGASAVTLESGGTGNGGLVTINDNSGNIIVTGDNSAAVYTQSVGGGGGVVGLAVDPPGQLGPFLFSGTAGGTGSANDTILNIAGNRVATGVNSSAIVAQSVAPGGNGNILITINNPAGGTSFIEGGSGQGAGVFIVDGANNVLTNNGVVTNVLDVNGYAVRGTVGNDAIVNNGLLIGSVDLQTFENPATATDINTILNTTNAVFNSGSTVILGTDPRDLLTNQGLISPGAYGNVFTTNETGFFAQTPTGVYGNDLDLRHVTADRINITGTATVSGTVAVNLVDPVVAAGFATPGQHIITILHADQGETHPGLKLQAPNTAAMQFSLLYPNGNDIDLSYSINYAPFGLNRNETEVGRTINVIQMAQASPYFRPVASALLFQPNNFALAHAYDTLSGEGTATTENVAFQANDLFLRSVMSQTGLWLWNEGSDPNGVTLYGDHAVASALPNKKGEASLPSLKSPSLVPAERTWHAWAAGYGGSANYSGNLVTGSAYTTQRGGGFAAGLDYQLMPNLLFGFAGGGGSFGFNVPDRQTYGQVDAWHAAAYGAWRTGSLYTMGVFSADFFGNNVNRVATIPAVSIAQPSGTTISVAGFNESLLGHFQSYSYSGYGETGYRFRPIDGFDVTPFAALQFGSLRSNAFTESNGGGFSEIGLHYAPLTTGTLPMFLGSQFNTKIELVPGIPLSAWLRLAWKHEFDNWRTVENSFITAPGYTSLIIGALPPRDSLRTNLGLKLPITERVSIYGTFDGDFASSSRALSGSGGVRVSW